MKRQPTKTFSKLQNPKQLLVGGQVRQTSKQATNQSRSGCWPTAHSVRTVRNLFGVFVAICYDEKVRNPGAPLERA